MITPKLQSKGRNFQSTAAPDLSPNKIVPNNNIIVLLKVYYHGQILLQTAEGVKFVCENLLDIIIPFTLSFEELKGVICEKMDSQISKRVSCILYKYSISVFGGFIQFQTKYVTDEASMQDMFSVYMETCTQISFIELYIEFEQSEAARNIELENYNSDSEEEFESNYECLDSGGDEDQADDTMQANVAEVANSLVNQQTTFMHSLDLDGMHTPEFPQYMNAAELLVVADGELIVGMEFSSREAVIKAMKDYKIRRGVDYREIRRYNDSHTCTRATISQDHSKLGSNTIAEAIKPLVEVDPSIKVKSVIKEVQSKFNYTVSYRKAWSAKHIESNFLRKFKALYLQMLIVNIGYLRTICEYEIRYQRLRETRVGPITGRPFVERPRIITTSSNVTTHSPIEKWNV
ncbi:hypothetical protein Ahy_B02g058557 isoform A [Arachis hypogaea]|uniref:Transposase MuDR plant domain-containing protein n=1 Tax=Arachis hypogaea TaxID=3818 RepID=A0A445AEU6_ARAHY|nr:hypothetical protein Ahy_B02g058557 isoform A [Arachis hypogaea]